MTAVNANLSGLIDRLEKATGPDRALDAAIAVAVGSEYAQREYVHIESRSYEIHEEIAKHYTASIDAALTLVPEGYGWVIDFMDPYEPEAMCGQGWCGRDHGDPDPKQPAIMLCIAALKALAANPT